MTIKPEELLTAYIDSHSTNLTAGTNLFYGPMQPDDDANYPNKAVFVFSNGGPAPGSYLGETPCQRQSVVQIMTRSASRDFTNGVLLAREVRDIVHYASLSGCLDVRLMNHEPMFLGEDPTGNYLWSQNAMIWYEE